MVPLAASVLAGCMVSYVPPAPRVADPSPPPAVRVDGAWAPSAEELRLGELLTSHPRQRRAALRHNPVLARVAREKALDMARRRYFSHTDPDGRGANTLVLRAGYPLHESYDRRPAGNNIESLGVGYASADAAWRRWMGSAPHRAHLLGLTDEFARQTEYGVGHAANPRDPGSSWWVVLIARPAE